MHSSRHAPRAVRSRKGYGTRRVPTTMQCATILNFSSIGRVDETGQDSLETHYARHKRKHTGRTTANQ